MMNLGKHVATFSGVKDGYCGMYSLMEATLIQVIPFLADKEPVFLPLLARGLSDLSALRFNAVEIEAQVNTSIEIKQWKELLQQPPAENSLTTQELWFSGEIQALTNLSMVFVLYDPSANRIVYYDSFQTPEDKFLAEWEEHLQNLILFLKNETDQSVLKSPRMYTKSMEAFLAFRKGLEILSQAKNDRTRDEGLESLLNAVAYDPDFIEAADILILFLMQNDVIRNYERCVDILERLRKLTNHHPRIPLVLAEVYFRWGDKEKAEFILKELVALFPQFSEGWIRLALLYHSADRLPEALTALEAILAFQPNEPTALDLMGAIYAGQGDRKQAEEAWLKTIEVDSNRVNVLNNLALLAEENEELEKAEGFYLQAIELNKEWWGTYFHYGSFCLRRERFEEAVVLLEKAVQFNSTNFQIFQNLATVQIQLGRYHEAQDSLLQLLQLAPDNPTRRQTLQMLGQLDDPQIKIELRIRQLERIWEAGKRWLVVAELIKYYNKAKNHWYYWYLWGKITNDIGIGRFAIITWLVGLKYNPGFPLLKKVGLHYWGKGKYRKALPILRRAYRFHKNDQETASAYLQTLINLGEVEELQVNVKNLSQPVKNDLTKTSV